MRVLYVEDHEDTRVSFLRLLGHHEGLEVVGVGSLHEAVETAKLEAFDVTLLDLNLPDSVGIRTVELAYRSLPLPIVVLTGVGDPDGDLARRAREAGAVDWIQKTASTKFIVRILRVAVAKSRVHNGTRIAAGG